MAQKRCKHSKLPFCGGEDVGEPGIFTASLETLYSEAIGVSDGHTLRSL